MKKIIPIDNAEIGMYLVEIVESEKKLQVKSQGLIKSSATIENLKQRHVKSIAIDLDKSMHFNSNSGDTSQSAGDSKSSSKTFHSKTLSFEEQQEQLAKADKLYTQARDVQSRFVKALRSGDAPDFHQLNTSCQDIIDSVFEKEDALSALIMLQDTNDYLVEHSLNCAILMSLFAKHQELSQSEIEDLTYAGLLMDIGMSVLPSELTSRSDTFSASDKLVVQTHVDIGIELAERHTDLAPTIIDVIQNHHERINGGGYPKQKTAESLSVYAQMAGIVDTYDAMISERPYRFSKCAQDVLEEMLGSPEFDSELVESFIKAMGLYPVGSLVTLQSGKLGIVIQKNRRHPLKPNVITFYSIRNKCHTEVKLVVLSKVNDKIIGAVRPEEFDINLPKFFKSVVLQA